MGITVRDTPEVGHWSGVIRRIPARVHNYDTIRRCDIDFKASGFGCHVQHTARRRKVVQNVLPLFATAYGIIRLGLSPYASFLVSWPRLVLLSHARILRYLRRNFRSSVSAGARVAPLI